MVAVFWDVDAGEPGLLPNGLELSDGWCTFIFVLLWISAVVYDPYGGCMV